MIFRVRITVDVVYDTAEMEPMHLADDLRDNVEGAIQRQNLLQGNMPPVKEYSLKVEERA